MEKNKPRILPGKTVILLVLASMLGCGRIGRDDRVVVPDPFSKGSVRLSILQVMNVSSVEVMISGGGLTSPMQSTLPKVPNTDYYQGLFENLPAGEHYTVTAVAYATTDVYAGLKAELTVTPGGITNVTIYLQKQGTADQTAPVITSVSFVSDLGMDFFYTFEFGTFTVATKHADTFTWSAVSGAFQTNNLTGVRYTASATVQTDTVTILVANSVNGKTAQTTVSVPMREENGAITVTLYFAPEITNVGALSGTFTGAAGEVMELTATSDPVLTADSPFMYEWSTTCPGIVINSGLYDALFRFTFDGTNANPADCLVNIALRDKGPNNLPLGSTFSKIIYRLSYSQP